MNSKVKAGLFFGTMMSVFFIAQNLISDDHHTTKNILIAIASGLLGGAVSGLLFGWIMGKFASSKFVSTTTKIDILPCENLVFHTSANHFKGMEAVGGKLFLTDKRLVFKSHKLNIQNHELSINLTDIEEVDRYKPLGLVNNGLSVKTNGSLVEKFVVEHANEWVSRLASPVSSLH